MTMGDPCRTLPSLEALDQLGPTCYGSFILVFGLLDRGPLGSGWTVGDWAIAKFGANALLGKTADGQRAVIFDVVGVTGATRVGL